MKNLLENIASYNIVEKNVSTPVQIAYMDYVIQASLEEQLENKKDLRHSTIGAIFEPSDEKIEEFSKAKEKYERSISPYESTTTFSLSPGASVSPTQTMGLKVNNLTIHPKKISSFENVRDEVIHEWIKASKISDCTNALSSLVSNFNGVHNGNQFRAVEVGVPNGTPNPSGISSGYRRMMTKCIQAGNSIAVTGRIGPATTILANKEILRLFPEIIKESRLGSYFVGGMVISFSDIVPKDRLYVIRSKDEQILSATYGPMAVIHNPTLNEYCLAIYPNIVRNCVELEII